MDQNKRYRKLASLYARMCSQLVGYMQTELNEMKPRLDAEGNPTNDVDRERARILGDVMEIFLKNQETIEDVRSYTESD